MTWTYDITKLQDPVLAPLMQTRLLCIDVDTLNPIFQDEEISVFLLLNMQSPRLAAAQALDVIAANDAYVQKVMKSMDITTNADRLVQAYQKLSSELRRQVEEGVEAGYVGVFDVAEEVFDAFSERTRILNQGLRSMGG